MEKWKVRVKLYNSRIITDVVHASDEQDARHKAFVYVIQKFKRARPEFLGVEPLYNPKR